MGLDACVATVVISIKAPQKYLQIGLQTNDLLYYLFRRTPRQHTTEGQGMGPPLMCLPCKHEYLSSSSRVHVRSQAQCHTIMIPMQGRWGQEDLQDSVSVDVDGIPGYDAQGSLGLHVHMHISPPHICICIPMNTNITLSVKKNAAEIHVHPRLQLSDTTARKKLEQPRRWYVEWMQP